MYDLQNNQDLLFQGDIIKNIRFLTLPLTETTYSTTDDLLPEPPVSDFFYISPELALANKYTCDGIIVSQNCDIDNRRFVLVAPVIELSKKYPTENNHTTELKKQKVNYELYLPTEENFPESIADLQFIYAVSKESLKIQDRILILSDYGRALLQDHIRMFLGRVEVKPYE